MPDEWKTANIIPIFKKGDRTNTGNYHPISLTSICSKLLEHIIYSSIFSHLKEYNILSDEQHGFQTGKSCESQLIMTINDFANCLNERARWTASFWTSQKHLTGSHTTDYVTNCLTMELVTLSCYGLNTIFSTDTKE